MRPRASKKKTGYGDWEILHEALPNDVKNLVNQVVDKTKKKVSRELVYDVNKFQKFLWKEYKEEEKRAAEVEFEGTKKAEAFNVFAEETFHRLYSKKEHKLETPAQGSAWAQKLHKTMADLPEFQRLQDRCRGKDWWSGTAGTTIMEKLLKDNALDPPKQIKDTQEYERSIKHLERMKNKMQDEQSQEAAQKQIEELMKRMEQALEEDQAAADKIDPSALRNSLRGAIEETEQTLDDADKAMEIMNMLPGTGTGEHNGRVRPNMKLLERLRGNKRFENLIDMVGRMERLAEQCQKDKARKGTNEVTGIGIGNNLSRILPTELLNLTDENLELLFYAKMYEEALLEYYLKENPIKKKGPIVVLLDTSASMNNGLSDAWALAVTLAIASIAHKQKRSFAVLLFDVKMYKKIVFKKEDLAEQSDIIELLDIPFSGWGTEFMSTLDEAVKVIEDETEFEDADIIMVTDGYASINDSWLKKFKELQDQMKFRVFSIIVGYSTRAEINESFSDGIIHIRDVASDQNKVEELFGKL